MPKLDMKRKTFFKSGFLYTRFWWARLDDWISQRIFEILIALISTSVIR